MNKFLIFKNEGEIDPVMFKTFGVSAKENEDPIGYFGTGLKYAIAIILRNGGRVTIYSGKDRYHFGVSSRKIRGKSFSVVTCNEEELGFTTELGKNWEMWMAYRELRSNCEDENGEVREAIVYKPKEGQTVIKVCDPKILHHHRKSKTIFLDSSPEEVVADGEIHAGESEYLYYRGIRVATLPAKSVFTYNITRPITLTEDRTCTSWLIDDWLGSIAAQSTEKRIIKKVLQAPANTMEKRFDYPTSKHGYSDEFLAEAKKQFKQSLSSLHHRIRRVVSDMEGKHAFESVDLRDVDRIRIDRAAGFCKKIGFDVTPYEIMVVESLGPSILALAKPDHDLIVLSRRVLEMGVKQIASCLVEEVVHLREGLEDCTINMQTYLFERIVTLGEEVTGEVI